jgi:hypothetical protein
MTIWKTAMEVTMTMTMISQQENHQTMQQQRQVMLLMKALLLLLPVRQPAGRVAAAGAV